MMNWKTWLTVFCILSTILIGWERNVFAGENRWTVLKKNVFKNSLSVLVVDPSNPNILYASFGNIGILKSVDGGKHWEHKNDGLLNKRIQKIVIDPFRPRNLYACTEGGLYHSTNGGEQWEGIGFTPNITVCAVTMVPQTPDTLYVATGVDLYRSQNGGKSWQLVPDTIHATIRAIVVSPVNYSQLYIGTDEGIYKIQDDQDSIRVLRGPDEWEQKRVDLVLDPFHTKCVFALSDTGGIIWTQESEWRWRQMNEGLQESDFPMLSLSINPTKPRTLYATTPKGSILAYDFSFSQIGLLEFRATGLSPWEISRITRYLAEALSENYSVKWLSRTELGAIDSSLTYLDDSQTVRNLGLQSGVEIVVSGRIFIAPDSIVIIPRITFVASDSQIVFRPIIKARYGYFPEGVNEVADWIHEVIGRGRGSWLWRNLWKGPRKFFLFGSITGLVVGYSLHSLLNDASNNQHRPELPSLQKIP
jgi:photosystem II stability/assembly factor-like uncharacterized protein